MTPSARTLCLLTTASLALAATIATPAGADHLTPGVAGATKINIYDNTHNGWNVATNDPVTLGPDPVIGFVNFHPTTGADPDTIKVVVALKDAAPNCDYDLQLVTNINDPEGGLPADGFHSGFILPIGMMTTNGKGIGNSGSIEVDVSGLGAPGSTVYAHVDIEDVDGDCMEADGTPVANNEYGASSSVPGPGGAPATIFHWTAP